MTIGPFFYENIIPTGLIICSVTGEKFRHMSNNFVTSAKTMPGENNFLARWILYTYFSASKVASETEFYERKSH